MIDLDKYRDNARKENLCEEYSQMWDSCGSLKQYMDMALSTKGVDYLCDSIAKGWGISPEHLSDRFSRFINGRYISKQKNYESELYCEYNGSIAVRTAILTLINCKCDIYLPVNNICEIYVTGKSAIHIKGAGRCIFVCYGKEEDINIITDNSVKMKRINKKNRDLYG